MEKGAKSGSGFGVSHKKSSSNSDFVSSMKKKAILPVNHLLEVVDDSGGGGAGGGGRWGVEPTTNNSGANEVVGNTYRDDVSSSHGGGENSAKSTNPSYSSINPFKSPGMMAANVGFPFTAAQWKELERQAMIYKYMISSVPVPADLLFPFSTNFAGSSAACNGSRYSRNGDLEPGRCKRTDGKKWRCSKEVAPHQKYCERHLHRGRPRSRKPVEVKNNGENHHKKTRLDQSRTLPTVQANSTSQEFVAANQPLLLFNAKTDLTICTPSYNGTNRDLSLRVNDETVARDDGAELQWQHLMEANMGLANEGFSVYSSNNAPIFHQDYVEQQPWDVFSTYPKIEGQTGFVDAWSVDDTMNITDNRNLESSGSLTMQRLPSAQFNMAMAAADVLDEEMRSIQMRTSVNDYDHKIKDSIRLSPVSWELFARGGPLGEALQPGSLAIGGSNPTSPYNSISTPATTVSSPSGVLQRTLFSHSDGSVCNSPTLGPPLTSEAAGQWLN
ncbi:Growth-regulating factor 7 [Sesamum alatum]|uniref:Growth-regulating factor n=1 Tax=Sesamum alatum TaxID=300844 RepID=A0AAE2CVM2_9LAMI|nr:Growth-regulating factor 7 [Sesamum alatum]